jgi:hypothetical protein
VRCGNGEGSGFNVTIADQYIDIGHDGRRKYYCVGIGIIVIVIIKSCRGRRSSVVVVAVIIIDARWARATRHHPVFRDVIGVRVPPLPRNTIFPTEALPVTPVSVNAFLLLSGIFADLLLELGVLFGSLIYCIQIYYSHTSVVFFTCFKIIPFPTNILDKPHIR